jgi:hypothetical protein
MKINVTTHGLGLCLVQMESGFHDTRIMLEENDVQALVFQLEVWLVEEKSKRDNGDQNHARNIPTSDGTAHDPAQED